MLVLASWLRVGMVGVAVALLSGGPLAAQRLEGGPGVSPDTARVEMRALLEKTIFRVDVLTLVVQLEGEWARAIRSLVAGQPYSQALDDSVAHAAAHSRRATARIVFKRSVRLDQFLDGVDDNMRRAVAAGYISDDDYRMISGSLPQWFSFLAASGISKGDQIVYEVTGDSLRTRYNTTEGTVLLDQVDVGPERRLAVLGSYFAPASDFRKALVRSLFADVVGER